MRKKDEEARKNRNEEKEEKDREEIKSKIDDFENRCNDPEIKKF